MSRVRDYRENQFSVSAGVKLVYLATQVQRRTVIISFVGKELHRFWMRSMQVLKFLNEINLLPLHAYCVLVKVEMLC